MRSNLARPLALLALALSAAARAQDPANWAQPTVPLKLYGNVYYVGTAGLSAFLLTGPQGDVLIDGGVPAAAPLVAANIEKLGFKLHDVKILLLNHSHFDHSGGLAALKRLTGARLVATAGEKADLEAGRTLERTDLADFPAVKVDRVIGDGDTVALGPVVLRAILTPGHTKGSISWIATTAGKRIIFASSITVAGQKLVNNPAYPNVVADFRNSFTRLRATQADIFVNFHSEGFDMERKRKTLLAGDANAFVDPAS